MSEKKKYKILWATDSPCVNTGFGRVSQELIRRLLETGKYEIHVMGTNDKGDPHPMRDVEGLKIYPLTDFVGDPYGFKQFAGLLQEVKPDLVFSLNDIWVWTGDEKRLEMDNWFVKSMKSYRPYVPWVAYFAVDGRPWDKRWVSMAKDMTKVVCMADYGYEVLSETPGIDMDKVEVIPHGASIDKFFPVEMEKRNAFRKQALGVDDDVFLVGCVARNQPRKNIPRLIEAFKCFSDGYKKCKATYDVVGEEKECGRIQPISVNHTSCEKCGNNDKEKFEYVNGVGQENCCLYLHMHMVDMRGHRLPRILNDFRLHNVVLRPHHHVGQGVPIEELNLLYNAMDVHVLTSLSGGFELPIIEAQAAGTPNIGTRSTAMTEHLDNGKGFLVHPESTIIFDDANHCHKHIADLEELVKTLFVLYNDKELRQSVIPKAMAYAHTRNWDAAAEMFDKSFEEALKSRVILHEQFESEESKKIVLLNQTKDPAVLLSMTPLIRKLRQKYEDAEIVMACDPSAGSLIENNRSIDRFIDVNRLWIEGNHEIKNLSFNDVSDFIPSYVSGAAKFAQKTWEQVWFEQFKVPIEDPKDLKMDIFTSSSDRKFADKCFEGSEKFKVGICVDSTHPMGALGLDKWQELINLLSRVDKIDTFVFNTTRLEIPENVTMIDHGESLKALAACIDKCDLVITMDNAFVEICKALEKRMLIVQGPKDVTYKLGDYTNYITLQKDKMFECMPCWASIGGKCNVTRGEEAACLVNLGSVEIFGAVMKELAQAPAREEAEKKEGAVVG